MKDQPTQPSRGDRETKSFDFAPQRRPHILEGIPRAIRFITTDLEQVFTVDVQPMMVVGRRNSMKDMDVVVDLADYEGYEQGVSRFHAMILALDTHVTIKDLNSLNGTKINNLELQPSQEYILEHGDKVTFGFLTFMVAFVY